jgi:hypothetical protein
MGIKLDNTTESQHDLKLPATSCFNCKFIRIMNSGKDWCVNDKSWMVGWISDIKSQCCKHHILRK